MGYIKIRDNAVWAKHIEGDEPLRRRILSLPPGSTIDLEVDGIVGVWQKSNMGRDGRETDAVKPVGPMREIWARFQARRGEVVPIRESQTADSYLKSLTGILSEWDSAEDNEAFHDL